MSNEPNANAQHRPCWTEYDAAIENRPHDPPATALRHLATPISAQYLALVTAASGIFIISLTRTPCSRDRAIGPSIFNLIRNSPLPRDLHSPCNPLKLTCPMSPAVIYFHS
jgi:hypothetical protein